MDFLLSFLVGGVICLIGQLMMDLTSFRVTPAHVLVSFVTAGALISGFGVYEKLVELAGTGATLPLTGFGHLLTQGAIEGFKQKGILGLLGGGIANTATGISAAIIAGYIIALIFKPKG
ncbi:stage V sporulation protein AE [Carboxydothermus ferrireducens]|uniref:Stage V sporulation protein AE n=1 Tax=Carboxydothermus ferrireducens DSM 11255 TaxID=1119529 RepID=A0ABX2RBU7_9THEO|nr:stage V sporulation protein AE [Carboxydothermus ferrireducens]NYE58668.1 stage V sporulation protein AE [Carboxydothermus ferrireducens DSM 11255]